MIILTFTVYSDERETTRIAFAPVFHNKKIETYAWLNYNTGVKYHYFHQYFTKHWCRFVELNPTKMLSASSVGGKGEHSRWVVCMPKLHNLIEIEILDSQMYISMCKSNEMKNKNYQTIRITTNNPTGKS